MIQHGQAFKLKTTAADGQLLWAYRYRFEGRRGSERPQVGGFASKAEKALRKVLDRLGPGGSDGRSPRTDGAGDLPPPASGTALAMLRLGDLLDPEQASIPGRRDRGQ